jgi:hypothetical protein
MLLWFIHPSIFKSTILFLWFLWRIFVKDLFYSKKFDVEILAYFSKTFEFFFVQKKHIWPQVFQFFVKILLEKKKTIFVIYLFISI